MNGQFGFDEWTTAAVRKGHKENRPAKEKGKLLGKKKATKNRGAAALINYYVQDAPDALIAAKAGSEDIAHIKKRSWMKLKSLVRFLMGREAGV